MLLCWLRVAENGDSRQRTFEFIVVVVRVIVNHNARNRVEAARTDKSQHSAQTCVWDEIMRSNCGIKQGYKN